MCYYLNVQFQGQRVNDTTSATRVTVITTITIEGATKYSAAELYGNLF